MSTVATPRIIYLDQNKWIELACAEKYPTSYPAEYAVLEKLRAKFASCEIILPLSATNVYETYKTRDAQRRRELAFLQASLSGALVFRGRYRRVEEEFFAFLANFYPIEQSSQAEWWFLSDLFFEAFSEIDDRRTPLNISAHFVNFLHNHPATALYDFLMSAPDDERSLAIKNWSAGSEALRLRIEARRLRHREEDFAMRKRIYNVLMFANELDLLTTLAAKRNVRWNSVSDIPASLARRLVDEMPIYHSERELAVRLEDAKDRPITENDFRDMQAYCAAIPYADEVIGENTFINLAVQSGLGKKYGTRLDTEILSLAA